MIKPAMAPIPNVCVDDSLPFAGCVYLRAVCCSVENEAKRTAELAPCFMIYQFSVLVQLQVWDTQGYARVRKEKNSR